jgi:hypothetical protein
MRPPFYPSTTKRFDYITSLAMEHLRREYSHWGKWEWVDNKITLNNYNFNADVSVTYEALVGDNLEVAPIYPFDSKSDFCKKVREVVQHFSKRYPESGSK